MSQNKVLSALALAKRAGKLVTGFDAVMKSARKRETVLVILAAGLSPKTVKEAEFHCARIKVPAVLAEIGLDEAETVLGKRAGVFGVTDAGFRRLIETAGAQPLDMD